MILDILLHAMALDIGWFIALVLTNPFWVMVFATASYFMSNKRAIFAGTVLALYLHSTVDAAMVFGWGFGSGLLYAPIIIFFGQFLFDTFLGKTKFNVKRGIFTTILFFASMVLINVVLV